MTDLQAILGSAFQSVPLYLGLVDLTNFTGLDPTSDTMSSHTGWQEYVDYAEATRPLWNPTDPTATYPSTMNNPDPGIFTPTVDGKVYGVFLSDNNVKGGSSGQLYGPFFFQLGARATITGAPFTVSLQLTLKRNTPWTT